VIGDKILEPAAARVAGSPVSRSEVLDKVGHALQRPFREPRCDRLRACSYCLCTMALMAG